MKPENKEHLTNIRNAIADENNAFCMEDVHFGDSNKPSIPVDSFKGDCGTPSCIAGWAVHLDDQAGIGQGPHEQVINHYSLDNNDQIIMPHVEVGGVRKSYHSNAEWFTRKRTVAMLDHLIETEEVNWFALEENS